MTKIGLIQFLLLFVISAAWGQKVKYKDIYALLSTKQYEQAEPFLKHYLRANPDNPNAWLFMGNIFQDKASKNDVLKQTDIAVANMDSAISFYAKATQTIDERELRKNKEYYESYNRRDLRTGEFGVKLSDIQFDISKKIEALKERVTGVKMTKQYFAVAEMAYQRSNALFISLQKKFPTEHQLYLRADEETIGDLTTLELRFDSCMRAFEAYKTALSQLGKVGYHQEVSLVPIEDFKKQGATPADFFQDDIRLWDYKQFAHQSLEIIQKKILPLREHLVDYDTQINKLREKLKDSVSVRSDLTQLIDKLLYDQLKEYDAEPMPMLVFAMKTSDLEARSIALEHKPLRDSANLYLQVSMLQDELAVLHKLDSIGALLTDKKLEETAPDYSAFIADTYGDLNGLKAYVRSLQAFALSQQAWKQQQLKGYLSALNYIVDGADTIPLVHDSLGIWTPLMTAPDKFTIGVSTGDTTKLQGYFYTITPSRTVDVKAMFPLDPKLFHASDIPVTSALARADGNDQIYYVLLYSAKAVKEKFPATLAKIYRSDGLAWKKDVPLTFTPTEMMLNPENGELVILSEGHELVVDKNGKVVE